MANNIKDYILWRGDIPLEVSPLNEVDNLILSQLSYALWNEVVSSSFDERLTLSEAIERFFALGKEQIQKTDGYFSSAELIELMALLRDSRRFSEMRICGFVDDTDVESEQQFSAVTILTDEETAYVSYRGTDGSMVGWKEDFNMSFMYTVPSQNMAISYLHDVMVALEGVKVYVGGHSKGGNLAIYASAFIPAVLQPRILAVYNNDGPGLMKTVTEMDGYQRIKDRIRTFVPQSSVIGMILEHEDDFEVVHSSQISLYQHSAFSWNVLGTQFVHAKKIGRNSLALNKAFRDWVSELDYEDKQKFFGIIFDVIAAAGIETTSDLKANKLKGSYMLIKNYNAMNAEDKKLLKEGFRYFLASVGSDLFAPLPEITQLFGQISGADKQEEQNENIFRNNDENL